ncbi:anthranilate synthase component I family protein [Thermodesulforhabdus norvegica]|uniref:Para-aminobenzoate synthetase component 1 n=1 Tax=Thermodesulforhabdus norvegica TaxID=39841 RepID=A0A1I4U8I1_9BACT|nr:anthranilate synthase component I family protein [Thermodesulforhabdus norvegica]SFM85131.1 para-aminobenzoate synthetase component 1 [Thermodesulforhabdus norvegica]
MITFPFRNLWKLKDLRLVASSASDEDFIAYARSISRKPFSVVLLSGGDHDAANFSIACWKPAVAFWGKGSSAVIEIAGRKGITQGSCLTLFEKLLNGFEVDYSLERYLPFMGGAVGFLTYEVKNYIERLPQTAQDDLKLPDIWAVWPAEILLHDRKVGTIYYLQLRLDSLKDASGDLPSAIPPVNSGVVIGDLVSNFSRNGYIRAVKRIINYIRDGHVYQVNLSQRFSAPIFCEPFELWVSLYRRNPAPFYAFINGGDFFVLCTSMERFLYLRDGIIETRPIKGTRPRGSTPEEDEANREDLAYHPKDDAELSMIVDLLRNDLGKVCKIGTVSVDEHKRIEAYQNVFHLISIVRGRLKEGVTYGDIIRATFPGGSITGCPKIRSMEIIDELEPNVRHVYTGSIGYWGFHGNMDLNIAIRTMIIRNSRAYLSVGGGIVFDSDPVLEYEETLHKGRTFFEVLKDMAKARAE